MKLATYRDGSRDGQLLVVSRDLSTGHYAAGITTRLQQVLDDWNFLSPQLEDLYTTLNHGKARHAFSFDPARCAAPLPRAWQWVYEVEAADDASAATKQPLMCRAAGDALGAACDDVVLATPASGVAFEARLVAVTGDVACGVSATQALEGIRLLMVSSSAVLLPAADPMGSQLGSSLSPVAVTPDELGAAWAGGRVQLDLQQVFRGQRALSCPMAAVRFHLGELIAHLARVRSVGAGSLIGGAALRAGADDAHAAHGSGDGLRLQVKGADGQCVFGVIDQHVRGQTLERD